MHNTLFPTGLNDMEWQEFPADGFPAGACGVIHRKGAPASNGLPLGSVDTGCLDLETDGTLGYCTIFNSHVPRRGPLNLPFLGLCLHNGTNFPETWVLSTKPLHNAPMLGPFTTSFRPKRACPAEDIHYWGHYPIADLEYELDCPVSVGLRAWTPFIPGDAAVSNTPGAAFEVRLRNTSETAQAGLVVFSFPGPSAQETAGHSRFQHIDISGSFRGVVVTNDLNQEYALGIVNGNYEMRTGGDLGVDGGCWSNLDTGSFWTNSYPGLPPALDQPGASAAVQFEMQPGEEQTIRFILAWYSPAWQGGGQAPWIFGGITGDTMTPPCELAMPSKGYSVKPQTTLDGPCYVDMIDRLWRRTGDRSLLDEFYESMKRNTIFTMNLRPEDGPAGIVSVPTGNNAQDWMESCDLFGIVPHIGGVHLANLRMAERMAREVDDEEFARQCAEWFRQGSTVLEEKTWTGEYYLLYLEEATGKRSDTVMGCQLDGEWMAKFHGLESAFRPERVKTTLETLRKTNIYPHGATVFRMPKEGEFLPGYWGEAGVHFPSSIMLAATYLYDGQREVGLDLACRTVRALVIERRGSWDSVLLFRGDDAGFLWGADYYQNMMLWCLPAAIAGEDLTGPCREGGLVERMIQAGAAVPVG